MNCERCKMLEAALREARGFLPAKDSAYYLLSEELRRVIGEVDDALAAQSAQEQKQPAKCCDCPPGLRWAGQYGEGMCYCKCHEEGQR